MNDVWGDAMKGRTIRSAIALALTLAVAVGAGIAIAARGGQDGQEAQPDPVSARQALDFAPEVTAWTGTEFFVLGRKDPSVGSPNDGAAYNSDSDEWRELPRLPGSETWSGVSVVWTGSELVALGIACENRAGPEDDAPACYPGSLTAASYEPGADSWKRLDAPPVAFPEGNDGSLAPAVGWTGEAAVFDIAGSLWEFDPTNGSWTQTPPPPKPDGERCVAGRSLVVGGNTAGEPEPTSDAPPPESAYGLSLLTTERQPAWKQLPVSPAQALYPNSFSLLCGDGSVLVYTANLDQVWQLDLASGKWTAIPVPPRSLIEEPFADGLDRRDVPASTSFINAAWTGRDFVWWNPPRDVTVPVGDARTPQQFHFPGNAVVFDPQQNAWAAAMPGPQLFGDGDRTKISWDGGRGYLIGGIPGAPQLTVYEPGSDGGRSESEGSSAPSTTTRPVLPSSTGG